MQAVQLHRTVPRPSYGLSMDTKVKGKYESILKSCLLEQRIPTSYEPYKLPITLHGLEITYTPDFVVRVTVDGKPVALETHPMNFKRMTRSKHDLNKFIRFKTEYGDQFHFVMISDIADYMLYTLTGIKANDFCDEYWEIPQVDAHNGMNLKNAKKEMTDRLAMLIRRADVYAL